MVVRRRKPIAVSDLYRGILDGTVSVADALTPAETECDRRRPSSVDGTGTDQEAENRGAQSRRQLLHVLSLGTVQLFRSLGANAGMSFAAVGVDRAAGLTVGEREVSIVGFREEASTSLLLAEKYLSLLEIGVMSMTMLEGRMEDVERDEWCLNIDRDRETFAR